MILELTEEEANEAYNLIKEESFIVEDLIDKYHQINEDSSELDKKDAEEMKHQLEEMKSIITGLSR